MAQNVLHGKVNVTHQGHLQRSMKFSQQCVCYCEASTKSLVIALALTNPKGGNKNGNHFNNNIEVYHYKSVYAVKCGCSVTAFSVQYIVHFEYI